MKIELFRTGKWNGKAYTKADLNSIVENSASRKVPVTLGHDVHFWAFDNQPAMGTIENQSVEGDSLIGEMKLNAKGQELFDSGEYPNWSVGIAKSDDKVTDSNSGKWLHHLALLGSAPPAVPDLKSFSAETTMDFFSINGETKNIEILTFTQGESNVKTEKTTEIVEDKTVDFSNSPEFQALLKQNEMFKKDLENMKLEKEIKAKDIFRDTYSKEFKTEDLDSLLTNSLINSETLEVFSSFLDARKPALNTGNPMETHADVDLSDEIFTCNGGK
jgi:hypothetical protein